tara:strand:+ start:713 stop:1204 length:492 start_codon:yes stop_codon:yes gene_type:complete
MIRGIHHLAISTPDLERLVTFYRDILGFKVIYETSWENREVIDRIVGLKKSAARQVMLQADNTHIEIFQYESPEPALNTPNRPVCDHGYTHLCLDVVDIDAEYKRLSEAGVVFHTPPPGKAELSSGTVRATYGRDPDGNVIELQEVYDSDNPMHLDNLRNLSE